MRSFLLKLCLGNWQFTFLQTCPWTVGREPLCSAKSKGSDCSLFKWAATAFWLCREPLASLIPGRWRLYYRGWVYKTTRWQVSPQPSGNKDYLQRGSESHGGSAGAKIVGRVTWTRAVRSQLDPVKPDTLPQCLFTAGQATQMLAQPAKQGPTSVFDG